MSAQASLKSQLGIQPEQSESPNEHENGQENKVEEEEEDDYMSMTFIEAPKERKGKETFAQKRLRKLRESEEKSRVPSKAELSAAEAARRDAALATPVLDPSSKGFQMMARLGYKPGSALGKDTAPKQTSSPDEWNQRLTEPLGISVKEGRGGIGMDSEKKRKFREEVDLDTKRVKAEEGDFRDRIRSEREEKRQEGQFIAAQKVAERLDNEAEEEERNKEEIGEVDNSAANPKSTESTGLPEPSSSFGNERSNKTKIHTKPTSQINILYRGLVRDRETKLLDRQAANRRYDSLSENLSRPYSKKIPTLPTYDDGDLETDDKIALGRTPEGQIVEIEAEDEEDEELEEFNALSAYERLSRAVIYLREKYHYCFWCKYRYETADMDGCPGLTEEDHD